MDERTYNRMEMVKREIKKAKRELAFWQSQLSEIVDQMFNENQQSFTFNENGGNTNV